MHQHVGIAARGQWFSAFETLLFAFQYAQHIVVVMNKQFFTQHLAHVLPTHFVCWNARPFFMVAVGKMATQVSAPVRHQSR